METATLVRRLGGARSVTTVIEGRRLIDATEAAGCRTCATPCVYAPARAMGGCRRGRPAAVRSKTEATKPEPNPGTYRRRIIKI